METIKRSWRRRDGDLLGLLFTMVAVMRGQQPAELIVRNGTIVTPTGGTEGDVRIRNGTIAEVGRT